MRPISLAVAGCIALAAATVHARDMVFEDGGHGFLKVGLVVRAERLFEGSKEYFLVRVQSSDLRMLKPWTGLKDVEKIDGSRLEFLPTEIRCEDITLTVEGKTLRPDDTSLCGDVRTFVRPDSMPLFVAFRYPKGRQATLTIPVRVKAPPPPRYERHESLMPYVDKDLIGLHELSTQTRLD